ncbi:MAG: ABC transporter permease subunit [Deltaproteobacteria bacterium]|nr:ABC transporter permease subunit [Deltaproteobacteria bacterium]
MTTPDRPAPIAALASLLRLSLLRLWRGRQLKLALAITLLVSAIGIAARYATGAAPEATEKAIFDNGLFLVIVYVLPILLASGALADEIDSRTLTYLLVRPVPRSVICIGKYLAAALATATLLVAAVLVVHVGCFAAHPAQLVEHIEIPLRAAGGLGLVAFAYCAIGLFFGALVAEAPSILTALWFLLMEFAAGIVPGPFRLISLNHHAQNVAGLLDAESSFSQYTPAVEPWTSALIVAAAAAGWICAGALVVRFSDFRFGRA